jgi:hypothetical protein
MSYNVELIDVKDDGDCFYRAIYGYAMYYGFLDTLLGIISCKNKIDPGHRSKIDYDYKKRTKILRENAEEDNCVQCIRNMIRYGILNNNECRKKVEGTFKYLLGLEQVTYNEIVQISLPRWIITNYPTQNDLKRTSIENFVNFVARGVTIERNWASQLEYDILNELLKPHNIDIQVISIKQAYDNIPNQRTTTEPVSPSGKQRIITETDAERLQRKASQPKSLLPPRRGKQRIITETDVERLQRKASQPKSLMPQKKNSSTGKTERLQRKASQPKSLLPPRRGKKQRIITETDAERLQIKPSQPKSLLPPRIETGGKMLQRQHAVITGGAKHTIYLHNINDLHYNFIVWVPTHGLQAGGVCNNKIFIYGKIRRKYYEKGKNKHYVIMNNKKLYLRSESMNTS